MNDLQQITLRKNPPTADAIDHLLGLARPGVLALSNDGSLLVGAVDYLDESDNFRSVVYEVGTEQGAQSQQLFAQTGKITALCFGENGQLYFSEILPGETHNSFTHVDPSGSQQVLARISGIRKLIPVPGTNLILIVSAVDIDGTNSRRKPGGVLHSHFPVRVDDSDQVSEVQFRLFDTGSGSFSVSEQVRGLTGDSGFFPDPTGRFVLANRRRSEHGEIRIDLVLINLTTGDCSVIHRENEKRLLAGPISPDGQQAVVQVIHWADATERRSLAIVGMDDGLSTPLSPEWDRWPSPIAWFPDGKSVLVRADDGGRTPLFRVHTSTGTVTPLTHDDGAYDGAIIHPSEPVLFALRASILCPGEAVRVDPEGVWPLGLPATQPDFNGTVEKVILQARDGVNIHCWLMLPPTADATGPLPLVVWVHGGPAVSWAGWRWARSPWPLVADGFAVLMPDIAMSTGYGQEFIDRGWGDWGGAALRDLLDVTRAVATRPEINADHIAVVGTSFGGYLASWAAAAADDFSAAVAHAPLWDLEQFHPTTDDPVNFTRLMSADVRMDHSPRSKVENIRIPMLVSQGGQDSLVPREQAFMQWYELLSRSALAEDADGQSPHRFLYLPDEGHRITSPEATRAWYEAMLGFLGEHLAGRPDGYSPELPQREPTVRPNQPEHE